MGALKKRGTALLLAALMILAAIGIGQLRKERYLLPQDTGVPLDSVFAGAGVLGAAACAAALYGALQWRRSRKAR